jgi:hypothetical protein
MRGWLLGTACINLVLLTQLAAVFAMLMKQKYLEESSGLDTG